MHVSTTLAASSECGKRGRHLQSSIRLMLKPRPGRWPQ
ncbi:hypothetical protein [Azospirillum largimobile]